ncbi:MAG: cyclase family protein [Halobacteriota archaeon]
MTTHDLTHPLTDGMPTYPDDPSVSVTSDATIESDGYRVTRLTLGSHTGTHVDAPSHTESDGKTLGDFSLDTFRFDARRIDLRELGPRDPIPVDALPEPTSDDLLVLHTGWDDYWGTPRALDHPYLTREAARWCVDHGYHVATDGLSVDPTPSDTSRDDEPEGVPAHRELLGADRLIVENLTGLAALPVRFVLHAYPLALDADGAPVRALGITE